MKTLLRPHLAFLLVFPMCLIKKERKIIFLCRLMWAYLLTLSQKLKIILRIKCMRKLWIILSVCGLVMESWRQHVIRKLCILISNVIEGSPIETSLSNILIFDNTKPSNLIGEKVWQFIYYCRCGYK